VAAPAGGEENGEKPMQAEEAKVAIVFLRVLISQEESAAAADVDPLDAFMQDVQVQVHQIRTTDVRVRRFICRLSRR
jgi:hypothetical protein